MPATLSVANDVDLNSRWNVIVIALISLRTLNAQTSFDIYVVVRMESIIMQKHILFLETQPNDTAWIPLTIYDVQ